MVILGIDPGLATVGIGLIKTSANSSQLTAHSLLVHCTIETPSALATPARLHEISSDLTDIIKTHTPDLAVVEKLYFEKNQKTAMDVAEARGVILLTLQKASIPVIEPTPLELKSSIAGDGRADKRQMKDMVERTLKIDLSGVRDDAVDALGLALYGLHSGKVLL